MEDGASASLRPNGSYCLPRGLQTGPHRRNHNLALVASASLDTFGGIAHATDAVRIRFAQAPELCQKRGKVGSVKQRLLAELDAFEVTSFDRGVERSSANTEQVKCLADRVCCLRKTESAGVNRTSARVLIGTVSRHCSIRRIVFVRFTRVSHGALCHALRIE